MLRNLKIIRNWEKQHIKHNVDEAFTSDKGELKCTNFIN